LGHVRAEESAVDASELSVGDDAASENGMAGATTARDIATHRLSGFVNGRS